jgi:hypothetical protein
MSTLVLFLSNGANASRVSYRPTSKEGSPWYTLHDNPGSTWRDPTWAVNYPVPNFGVDNEILETSASIASSEDSLNAKMPSNWDKPKEPKRGYTVPNFGVDSDIALTKLNIDEAEFQHGTSIPVPNPDAAEPKRNYFVPNFGKDYELQATDDSLSLAEK